MRLALVTNVLSPYRVPLYREVAARVEQLAVFLTGREDNRQWCERTDGSGFQVKRVPGLVIKKRLTQQGVRGFDTGYFHVPLGLPASLAAWRPDAVISGEIGLRTAACWAYCRLHGKPLAVVWEGNRHSEAERGRLRNLVRRRFAAKAFPAWIAFGSAAGEYLRQMGVPPRRISFSHNCVDNAAFARPARPLFPGLPGPVLLYVGQLIPRKGVWQMLRAAELLWQGGQRFTLLLAGGGPLEAPLRRHCSQRNLENAVFAGYVQTENLPSLYASADFLVLPSLAEPWGLVVNEALASGLPVAASYLCGATADLVPPQWRFDPRRVRESLAPALARAVAAGRAARGEFPSLAELPTPSLAAEKMLAAFKTGPARRD